MKKIYYFVSFVLIILIVVFSIKAFGEKVKQSKAQEIPGMVFIPGGTFIMGSDQNGKDAQPAHKVYVSSFYMDKYEVTNAQYKTFLDSTGYPAPYLDPERYPWAEKYNWKDGTYPLNAKNVPVVLVSYEDANAYAKWAGKRLPTEAEWEKAARGSEGFTYPWGSQWDSTKCNSRFSGINRAVSVTRYDRDVSPYGVFNMAGNVWEWCADWYDNEYFRNSPGKDPKGPARGATRVIRGGSWDTYGIERLSAFARESQFPSVRSYDIGFRCAKDCTDKNK